MIELINHYFSPNTLRMCNVMVCLRASTGLSSRLASSSSLADIQAWRPGCPGATRCSQWLIVSLLAYAATTDRGSLPAPSWPPVGRGGAVFVRRRGEVHAVTCVGVAVVEY